MKRIQKEKKANQQKIDVIWEKIGKKLNASGIKQKDISKVIKEVRQANKEKLQNF